MRVYYVNGMIQSNTRTLSGRGDLDWPPRSHDLTPLEPGSQETTSASYAS